MEILEQSGKLALANLAIVGHGTAESKLMTTRAASRAQRGNPGILSRRRSRSALGPPTGRRLMSIHPQPPHTRSPVRAAIGGARTFSVGDGDHVRLYGTPANLAAPRLPPA
jgi:hypothetical protein